MSDSDYNKKMPVLSFRVPKHILNKFDRFMATRKESRQEYLKNIFIEDMRKKEVIKVIYE